MSINGEINSVRITPLSKVNGAVTNYTVTITSPVPLKDGDQFLFTFPPEIDFTKGLKTSGYLDC